MKISPSRCGGPLLTYNGYKYNRTKIYNDGSYNWRCSKRNKNCPAYLRHGELFNYHTCDEPLKEPGKISFFINN
jgi:hypothetical protein